MKLIITDKPCHGKFLNWRLVSPLIMVYKISSKITELPIVLEVPAYPHVPEICAKDGIAGNLSRRIPQKVELKLPGLLYCKVGNLMCSFEVHPHF